MNPNNPDVQQEVDIGSSIEHNNFDGFGIQHNGGSTAIINSAEVFRDN